MQYLLTVALTAGAICASASSIPTDNLAFVETFAEDVFATQRWKKSTNGRYESQKVEISAPDTAPEGFQDDMAATLTTTGLYAFGTTFPEPIDNKDKAFVVQYDVKLDDGLTCGGAYIKLLREQPLDITAVHDKTPYAIMFGPDKCGSTNKVHFILQHLNPKSGLWEEKHYKEAPMAKTDKKTHLYTLYIKPDNGFEIYIDKKLSKSGNLLTDMTPSVNPDEMIDDPEDKKPADWVDEVKIPEPGATKPDDWDESAPAMIDDASATMPEGWLENEPDTGPDPEAQKPEDWDDEEDGVWEAPLVPNPKCKIAPGCGKWTPPKIKNPDYKGKWKVPMIDNPAYKGEWAPRKIPNPYYFVDEHPHNLPLMTGLVVEVLTQNPNIHFDNFVISYDLNAAFVFADSTFVPKSKQEHAVEEQQNKEERIKEREEKKAEGGLANLIEVYWAEALDFISQNLVTAGVTGALLLVSLVYMIFGGSNRAPAGRATADASPADASPAHDSVDEKKDTAEDEDKPIGPSETKPRADDHTN